MATSSPTSGIGARLRAIRRERGYRTTKDLAAAMEGANVTEAVIENIEAGRKADITVSQLLNLAVALRVPVSFLLAPIRTPEAPLDLPNLGNALSAMTAGEFDSWLSGRVDSGYRARSSEELSDLSELHAYRDLQALRRELRRIRAQIEMLEGAEETTPSGSARVAALESEEAAITEFLSSADWDIRP